MTLENFSNQDMKAAVSNEDLQKEARLRASKEQPFLQRVINKLFKRDEGSFRELIINSELSEKRVALLQDGLLERIEVENAEDKRLVGAIFKGKIQNLEPGLKAAFVDIGQEKNAFLHYWDILPASCHEGGGHDHDVEFVRENRNESQQKCSYSLKEIPQQFPIGTEIVVQITKGQIGSKGPRTTTNLAIPGRYLVLTPYCGQCGISRKIDDPKERMRLKKIIHNLTLPPGMGVIFRTASEGQKERYFVRDLHILLKKWETIQQNMVRANEPRLLYQEPDIIERTVRDFLTEKIDRILVDNEEDFACILDYVKQISPRSKSKVKLFNEDIPIFERFGVESQIEQIFKKHITLPSGGSIVIQETEALTAIDVNTGAHKTVGGKGGRDQHDFIFQVNKEAVKEVVHQLQLRNIAGLIIVDFIDMPTQRQKRQILELTRDELRSDKAKTQALPIIQFGFMAITRQRKTESFLTVQHVNCPYCEGKGLVKSPNSISAEIQRQLYYHLRKLRKTGRLEMVHLSVVVSPYILDHLRAHDEQALLKIEQTFNAKLLFKANADCHMEHFRISEEKITPGSKDKTK